MSAYHYPEVTTVEHVSRWKFAEGDRPLLTETVPPKRGAALRSFRATYLQVTWGDGGAPVKVYAAGVVQYDRQDAGGFTSATWDEPPWPDSLDRYLGSGA